MSAQAAFEVRSGHVLDCLRELPPASIHACITSPPYHVLRSYKTQPQEWPGGWFGEHGGEPTLALWLKHELLIWASVRRVLRDDGILFINCGDSFSCKPAGNVVPPTDNDGAYKRRLANQKAATGLDPARSVTQHLPEKNLNLAPQRLALALQEQGWIIRGMFPWLKSNPIPESATDRPTTSIEYIIMAVKQPRYFYDAEAVKVRGTAIEPHESARIKSPYIELTGRGGVNGWSHKDPADGRRYRRTSDWFFESFQGLYTDPDGDPLAMVVNPQGFSGAHFATFPTAMVEPLVRCSTSERGVCADCGGQWVRVTEKHDPHGVLGKGYEPFETGVEHRNSGLSGTALALKGPRTLTTGWRPSCKCDAPTVPATIFDPFSGSGTTGVVAIRNGRRYLGIELSAEYREMSLRRLELAHVRDFNAGPPAPKEQLVMEMT